MLELWTVILLYLVGSAANLCVWWRVRRDRVITDANRLACQFSEEQAFEFAVKAADEVIAMRKHKVKGGG